MDEVIYEYKSNIIVVILSGLFFSGCTFILANMAITNDRGLILNRLFEFTKENATVFYWLITACSSIFVVLCIILIITNLTSKQVLILSDTTISIPKNIITKKHIVINFSDIKDIKLQSAHKQTFLIITHNNGKHSISKNMLSSDNIFNELTNVITSRVNG
jgi:hypothetical protein